ncbi:MAG: hypothetical protein ABI972_03655 [Acidobacteriota bacterium]
MRNPSLWRTVGITIVLTGLATGAATILIPDTTLGTTPKLLLFCYALTAIIFGSLWTAWRHADAIAYSALQRGQDILVRWRVDPADWDRFAALNETFSLNELPVRRPAPATGVEVIVGRRAVLIDGHLIRLHWPSQTGAAGTWTVESATLLPADPPCVNLRVRMAQTHGSPTYSNLVFPIAAAAQDDARRLIPWTS